MKLLACLAVCVLLISTSSITKADTPSTVTSTTDTMEIGRVAVKGARCLPLKNLTKVVLQCSVLNISPEKPSAFNQELAEQEIIQHLNDLGIKVIKRDYALPSELASCPLISFYETVGVSADDGSKFLYGMTFMITERVTLSHDRHISATVTTWQNQSTMKDATPTDSVGLMTALDSLLDNFAADYAYAQRLDVLGQLPTATSK